MSDETFAAFEVGSYEAGATAMERPDDTVIYPAEQVGAFSGADGVVLMTDVSDVSPWQWAIEGADRVDDPERFDREYAEWVHREDVRDEVLGERLEDAPEPQETEVVA